VLSSAACNAVNLVLAGTFATAALMFSSWWLLLMGLMACMVVTIYTISRPAFRRTLCAGGRLLRLSDLSDVGDPALQRLVCAFSTGRCEVESVLLQLPKEVSRHLNAALSSLDELEHCAARLVLRAQELIRLLTFLNKNALEEEVGQLGELVQRGGRETRVHYDNVLCCQRQQVMIVSEVTQAIDRAVAGLLRAIVLVKELPTRIVGLHVLDAHLKDSAADDLEELWERIHGELRTSEQTLKELAVEPPPALVCASAQEEGG
jgi:hypothetical protein